MGTPPVAAGVLGDSRTSILFGSDNVNDDFRSGIRAYSGLWLDECQTCGIECSFLYLEPGSDSATFICLDNNMIIARPFIDANTGAPVSALVCFPNFVGGSVFVDTQSTLWGTEINARKNLYCGCDARLDLIGGYRFLRLQDRLTVTENVFPTNPAGTVPAGTSTLVFDSFSAENTFNGGQMGLAGEWRRARFFVSARGVIALGSTHQEIEIAGFTRLVSPAILTPTLIGGLLAQPSNVGKYTFNNFAVVPEGTITVGYNVTDGIRASIGYTFLYWSNVSRAGDQIDLVVNRSLIPSNASRPAFVRNHTDFWAQGISFGFEIRF
jgi:hypothetical protein